MQANLKIQTDPCSSTWNSIAGVFAILWFTCSAGCSKPPEPVAQATTPQHFDSSLGEQIIQTRCFVCHGRSGVGDGPSAQGLGATVRDLTAANWQDSISDESIRRVIRNGAKAIGGSAAMPPNPDLSDAQIQSLTCYIRDLRKK